MANHQGWRATVPAFTLFALLSLIVGSGAASPASSPLPNSSKTLLIKWRKEPDNVKNYFKFYGLQLTYTGQVEEIWSSYRAQTVQQANDVMGHIQQAVGCAVEDTRCGCAPDNSCNVLVRYFHQNIGAAKFGKQAPTPSPSPAPASPSPAVSPSPSPVAPISPGRFKCITESYKRSQVCLTAAQIGSVLPGATPTACTVVGPYHPGRKLIQDQDDSAAAVAGTEPQTRSRQPPMCGVFGAEVCITWRSSIKMARNPTVTFTLTASDATGASKTAEFEVTARRPRGLDDEPGCVAA